MVDCKVFSLRNEKSEVAIVGNGEGCKRNRLEWWDYKEFNL